MNTRSSSLLFVVVVLNFFLFDTVSMAFVPTTASTRLQQQQQQQQQQQHRRWVSVRESTENEQLSHQEHPLKAADINRRLRVAMLKMKERDRNSRVLSKDDLVIVYQDDHIIVVDKPSGVLSVSSDKDIPSLCKTIYETTASSKNNNNITMSQMVVHRLGMDTSGLIVFCQTMEAVRGMHMLFRSRQVVKEYEALVCGHVVVDVLDDVDKYVDDDDDSADSAATTTTTGSIEMPLMRDYERPPYMRISTKQHQLAIASLDEPESVHKKFLEAPKSCITHYQVVSRDYLDNTSDVPVTRLRLTSISGRTHQLNVHCAAMGHPIVYDSIYGWNGEATPHGGLDVDDLSSSTEEQQQQADMIYAAAAVNNKERNMCIHASFLSFRHPVTKTLMSFRSPAPF